MKRLLYILLVLLLLFPLALVTVLFLAVDNEMKVNRVAEITPASIGRAREILRENDPRTLRSGQRQMVAIDQRDLDLTANYLVNRYAGGGARITLEEEKLVLTASVQLPSNPIGKYANIEASVVESGSGLQLKSLRIGSLPLPAWVANRLIQFGIGELQKHVKYSVATDMVKKVDISSGTLEVAYEWQDGLPDRLRNVFVTQQEQERLQAYHSLLVETIRPLSGKNIPLTNLLIPIFSLSQERSLRGDAIAENRSAILLLATYVTGRGFHRLVPASREWPQPSRYTVTLNGRDDLAKHFIVSAAIAAHAGSPLSDAIGLYKELSDAKGGSGFSFSDICADKAGTRFGEMAARSAVSARELQDRLKGGTVDLIPATLDLPDFLSKQVFARRFGGPGDQRYEELMQEIDRRIDLLTLYQ
ncbi:MAG: hypothetical protein KF749_01020 [Bacteroidetes bacterium]|nr:hypothetical protein [Bacteroidota bacterium]MCW5897267.1 hypothetical protein [Bacteroidota bacterium]